MDNLAAQYEQDFDVWIQQHINLLKQGRLEEIDIKHLIEELEDMGKSNIRELESRFVILIAHLLKWQFQSKQQSNSWRGSIDEQRIQIARLQRKVPSLKRELQNAITDAYADAVKLAMKETKLSGIIFPDDCPYTIKQLLDEDFYPHL